MKKQLLRLAPRAHVRRTVTRALWKGINVISVISLVLSTSFASLTIAPSPLHAGQITGINLSGAKFNDLNGNGGWDKGEPGLPGWTINLWTPCSQTVLDYTQDEILNLDDSVIFTEKYLAGDIAADANTDGVVNAADMTCAEDAYSDGVLTLSPSGIFQTRITDADGYYGFSELPINTYWLSEEAQDGWTQTTTPTMYGPLTDNSDGNIFGNFHAASVSGMKFNDANGNGTKNEGESGLNNWTIRLWATCDVARADYDDDGVITLADAVLFTTPYSSHDSAADIHADSMVNVVDYDCMKALVNQNPADGNWYVIRTTQTNVAGNYSFTDVPAGDYRVDELQQVGWTKTLPVSDYYDVTLVSNGDVTNKDFGNFHNGSIAGMKFHDINGNGVNNEGDVGLPNWTINLWTQCSVSRADYNEDGVVTLADAVLFTTPYMANDLEADVRADSAVNPMDKSCMDALVNGAPSNGPWVVVRTTTTDASGNYIFSGLLSGDYRVSEDQQLGWTKTLPADDFYAVTLATDENAIGKDFGNTQAQRESSLTISKTDGRETANPQDTLHYVITVTNNDTENAVYGAQVVDTLPSHIASISNISNGGFQSSGFVIWNNLTIPAEDSVQLSFDATLDGDFPVGTTVLTNRAELGNNNEYDLQVTASAPQIAAGFSGMAEDVTSVTVAPPTATLTLSKTDHQTTAKPGDVLHYAITVSNDTNVTATDVKVTDALPNNISLVTNISDGGNQFGTAINWQNLTIPADSSKVLTYDATIDPNLGAGDYVLHNVATLGCGSPISSIALTPCAYSGTAADDTSVNVITTLPVISLAKTAASTATAGGNVTYTLTYTVANASVTNLILIDPLPTGTTFVAASDSANYSAATNSVTWLLGTKTPGSGSMTVTLKTPAPIANGTVLTNTASLDSNETDPVSATRATTLSSAPALSIEKSANVAVATPGNTITYTVKVTNNGTDAAKDVTLNDVLPQGFTTLDSGASKLVIGLGTIAAGASVSTTYQTVTTTTLADGPYTNTATASATNAAAITAHADVLMRAPAVLGAETAGPQPQVLGAETSLPATGTGITDYMVALFGIMALAFGIGLTRPVKE